MLATIMKPDLAQPDSARLVLASNFVSIVLIAMNFHPYPGFGKFGLKNSAMYLFCASLLA